MKIGHQASETRNGSITQDVRRFPNLHPSDSRLAAEPRVWTGSVCGLKAQPAAEMYSKAGRREGKGSLRKCGMHRGRKPLGKVPVMARALRNCQRLTK